MNVYVNVGDPVPAPRQLLDRYRQVIDIAESFRVVRSGVVKSPQRIENQPGTAPVDKAGAKNGPARYSRTEIFG